MFESDFYNKDIPSSVFAFGAKIYNDLHSITGRLYSSYDIERLQFGFTFNSKTEEDKGTLEVSLKKISFNIILVLKHKITLPNGQ